MLCERAERGDFPLVSAGFKKKLTAPGIPRRSPIQVLTRPDPAWLPRSDEIGRAQGGMAVSKEFGGILASYSWVSEREGLEFSPRAQFGCCKGGLLKVPGRAVSLSPPRRQHLGALSGAPGESFPAFSLHFFGGMLLSSPHIDSNRFSFSFQQDFSPDQSAVLTSYFQNLTLCRKSAPRGPRDSAMVPLDAGYVEMGGYKKSLNRTELVIKSYGVVARFHNGALRGAGESFSGFSLHFSPNKCILNGNF